MKIPKKLKVGGIVYNVNITENLYGGCELIGEQNLRTHEINIRPTADVEETFIHEMVHAILCFIGKQEHDEEFVEAFSQALYAVIVDNKELFTVSQDRRNKNDNRTS